MTKEQMQSLLARKVEAAQQEGPIFRACAGGGFRTLAQDRSLAGAQEGTFPSGREGREVAVLNRAGVMPGSDAEALRLINALQPAGATPLTLDRVWIHYTEAASNTLMTDRWAFLDSSSLVNFARDAAVGVAFLNSHRTGGWSGGGELPYGRTFAGQLEEGIDESGRLVQRLVTGVYLLRGATPNGAAQIDTDQIHAGIEAGTIFDVSVGWLYGGSGHLRCNVCNQPYYGGGCPHWRGSGDSMTLDQRVYAQEVLGVPDGVATVSFVDCRLSELSAVYDGAVAGAGFLARR